jgi:hypothetical protein
MESKSNNCSNWHNEIKGVSVLDNMYQVSFVLELLVFIITIMTTSLIEGEKPGPI